MFDRLGRFAGLGPEMAKIAVESVIDYPALQIETAAVATAKQLIDVHTGEGVLPIIAHTYGIIERYTPQLAPAMHAARQQQGELSFAAINALHYPTRADRDGAVAGAPLARLARRPSRRHRRARRHRDARALGNAFVCGALGQPASTAMARASSGSRLSPSFWPRLHGGSADRRVPLGGRRI